MKESLTLTRAEDFQMLLTVLGQIWSFIHENQSLVAGGLALLAAIIAARPVWKQLQSFNRQVEIQSLGLVESQIGRLQDIRQKIDEKMNAINQQVFRAQYPNMPPWEDDAQPIDIHPETAFNIEQAAFQFEIFIERVSKQRRIPQSCSDAVQDLEASLRKFANTAQEIHLPASVHFDDPELAIPNWKEEKKQAIAKAEQAQTQISADLAAANDAAKVLIKKLDDETDMLLRHRQKIHEGIA